MLPNSQVMFVDDEEGVRRSWQRYLQGHGFETTTAPDGASAIDALSRHPVDVVVSDLRMPGKSGLDVLEWLHERQPNTRFILLTGYGDRWLEQRVRDLGAADYLEKPVSPDVLLRAIDRALDGGNGQLAFAVVDAPSIAERVEVGVEPAVAARPTHGHTIRSLITAPIFGLAFVVFLPVIGIGALGWVLVQKFAGSRSKRA